MLEDSYSTQRYYFYERNVSVAVEPLYNEVLGLTNYFFFFLTPVIVKYLSNRPHFLRVYRRDNPLGMLGKHSKSL